MLFLRNEEATQRNLPNAVISGKSLTLLCFTVYNVYLRETMDLYLRLLLHTLNSFLCGHKLLRVLLRGLHVWLLIFKGIQLFDLLSQWAACVWLFNFKEILLIFNWINWFKLKVEMFEGFFFGKHLRYGLFLSSFCLHFFLNSQSIEL